MLFDLRGRGRRRTVQVIYLSLAVLMGGGLVLFGIGGATPGGLVDAVSGGGSGGGSNIYAQRVKTYTKQTTQDPNNAQAWAALTKAQVQEASVIGYDQATGTYTDKGVAELRKASASWQKYLDVNTKKPDDTVASLMVAAYGSSGLNQPAEATDALQAVIEGRGGSAALYTQLAVSAYVNGDTRRSLIAERKAIAMSPPSKRKITKAEIDAQRKRVDQLRVQAGTNQATQTTTTPLGGG